MNCAECKELLVGYVEGLLEASEKQAIEQHLKDCRRCREEIEQLEGLQQRLAANGDAVGRSDLEEKVMNGIIREQKRRLRAAEKAGKGLALRRLITKSPISKLAAAAIIVVAAFVLVGPFFSPPPAFAKIVEPLLKARTAIFKMIVEADGLAPKGAIEGMFMHPGRMRMTFKFDQMPGESVHISDYEKGKLLVLTPHENKAVVLEMQNRPQTANMKEINLFAEIRDFIRRAREDQDESVKYLGKKQLDGVTTFCYRVTHPKREMTVWAHHKSLLPVRVEFSIPAIVGAGGTVVMTDIEFNVDLDEELFSTEPPEGYTLQTMTMDTSQPTEADFVEGLRIWTEFTKGQYPAALNVRRLAEDLGRLLPKMRKEQGGVGPSDEQLQKFTTATRGLMFPAQLDADSDWHYAGKDVKYGRADKPIFWYRPKDSATYRVVYGDLSVKDVAPEDLPK
ncbi:MAG: zf-HC2 domain-containing protein [Phycisphaerales bacterium]|nr:MAG: zf-HC2 domain-containing protein [Phycisphaerales bacterium]